MEQFRLPKIPMPELTLPQAVQDVLKEAEQKLAHRPKLLQLFKNCFPNTLGNDDQADGGRHDLRHYGRYSRDVAARFRRAGDSLRSFREG